MPRPEPSSTPPPSDHPLVRALEGVRIVVCGRCHGLGLLGGETNPLRCTCPECNGSGETTVNELETHAC